MRLELDLAAKAHASEMKYYLYLVLNAQAEFDNLKAHRKASSKLLMILIRTDLLAVVTLQKDACKNQMVCFVISKRLKIIR